MWAFLGFKDNATEDNPRSKHTSLNEDAEIENTNTVEEETLECDYEKNCTNLYKRIESEDWTGVSKFLETGYWPGNFFADPIPPADQVRTWVTRFNRNRNEGVRWSQLPLHLAIVVEAPYDVVGSLIELYPQAVRCTDDQHMLPLHLSMRHGSSDNIVDLLLAAFPEAVNAKGKNDRTPIECAVRGPNKVRARILGTFVERTKAKTAKSVTVSYSREVATLRSKLELKESELGQVKDKLAALDKARAALEQDLMVTKSEDNGFVLTRGMSTDASEAEAEIQKQITDLEKEKVVLEEARERACAEEKNLIDELERIHTEVAESASPEDLKALKEEIEALKLNRIRTQEQTEREVEEMKRHIAEELLKADGNTREELKILQQNIVELHRVASKEGGKSEDIATLKKEVEGLREELKLKENTAKIRVEISVLKEALAHELKDSEAKTQEQIMAINTALDAMKLSELDDKSYEELKAMKEEYEALHAEVKEGRLADKLTEDVVKLRRRVSQLSKRAASKDSRQDLDVMKKTLGAIKVAELQVKSHEELILLSADLKVLKDQLKNIEEVTEIRAEFAGLKTRLETNLKQARATGTRDVGPLKTALQKLKNFETKSKFELVALKFELKGIQEQIKVNQKLKETKEDIVKLKTEVRKLLPTASGNVQTELSSILKLLVAIDLKKFDNAKSIGEVQTACDDVSKAKKRLADQELALQLKAELKMIRKTIGAEVARMQENDKKDSSALKAALAKLTDEELDRQTTQELINTKDEVSTVDNKLKEKQLVLDDLESVRAILDEFLSKKEGSVKEDLLMMKRTVDAIDLDELDSDNVQEWEDLKSQIEFLKRELEGADIVDKTKQDLLNLKEALQSAIDESDGNTKEELVRMKTTVDAIDITKLDSDNAEAWMSLKTEIDELKKELKVNECERLTTAIQGKLNYTEGSAGLSKIEVTRATSNLEAIDNKYSEKTYAELVNTKEKLKGILIDIEKQDTTPIIDNVVTPMNVSHQDPVVSPEIPAGSAVPPPQETITQGTDENPETAKREVRTYSNGKAVRNAQCATTDKPVRMGFFGRLKSAAMGKGKTQKKTTRGKSGAASNEEIKIDVKEADSLDAAQSSQTEPQGEAVEAVMEDRDSATYMEEKKESEARSEPSSPTPMDIPQSLEDVGSPSYTSTSSQKVARQEGKVATDFPIVETVVTSDSDTTPSEQITTGSSKPNSEGLQNGFPMNRAVSQAISSSEGGEVETVFVE